MKSNLIIIFLFCCFAAFGQKQQNDWLANKLKGKVKSVKHTSTYLNTETGKWQSAQSWSIDFDENGNSVERLDFKEDGKLFYKTEYKRDSNSKLKESIVTWPDGKPAGKTVYLYDSAGNNVAEIKYKADGSLGDRIGYRYDNNGNKIASGRSKPNDELAFSTTYKYDKNGYLIETANDFKQADGLVIFTYKYDDKGRRIETNELPQDRVEPFRQLEKYDEHDNVIEFTSNWLASMPDHIIYKYEYDAQGNWLKKSTANYNEAISTIEERVIVYY
ncbi:MAG: hypothetical protein POELPBGB_01897 [Bacteroidia bacterium]|nr:hypothetical protein [Bacteroidia bacterium]